MPVSKYAFDESEDVLDVVLKSLEMLCARLTINWTLCENHLSLWKSFDEIFRKIGSCWCICDSLVDTSMSDKAIT